MYCEDWLTIEPVAEERFLAENAEDVRNTEALM